MASRAKPWQAIDDEVLSALRAGDADPLNFFEVAAAVGRPSDWDAVDDSLRRLESLGLVEADRPGLGETRAALLRCTVTVPAVIPVDLNDVTGADR